MKIVKIALKEYIDVDRVHQNKNFGSNCKAQFELIQSADVIVHVPVKPILKAMGESNAFVVVQTGVGRPMEDFYGHGFTARFKVKHSTRMPYKMAVSMFGDLTVNSMPLEIK